MGIWNEHMERTRESMRVMARARKALDGIFKYALEQGVEPDGFCYVVNEAATTIAMRHAIEIQLSRNRTKKAEHDKV